MMACQIEAGIAQHPINDSAWTMDIKEHIDTSLLEHVDTRSVDVRRSLPFGQSTPKYVGHIYTFHRISLNIIRFILTSAGEVKNKNLGGAWYWGLPRRGRAERCRSASSQPPASTRPEMNLLHQSTAPTPPPQAEDIVAQGTMVCAVEPVSFHEQEREFQMRPGLRDSRSARTRAYPQPYLQI